VLIPSLSLFNQGEPVNAKQAPPDARPVPQVMKYHQDELVDNYAWLRDRENPETIAYLKAENAYTAAEMAHTAVLQDSLYHEMKRRIKETDLSVPMQIDGYYYYSRTEKDKQYGINCRRRGSMEAPEEILLDENAMAKGHDYFSVGTYQVSPDHNLLAFSVDTTGDETYHLLIKDLRTGEVLPDRIERVDDAAWATDNQTLFYTTLDAAHRPHQLHRHRVGEEVERDRLIYREEDERFWAGVHLSKSRDYLFLTLGSNITSEAHYLPADDPDGEFRPIEPRRQGVEYSVSHHEDYFYIVTNDQAINFRLLRTPVTQPSLTQAEEVIPHRPEIMLDDISIFQDYLVIYTRVEGFRKIQVQQWREDVVHTVQFPEGEPVYAGGSGGNPEFNTRTLRLYYTSLVTPPSIYDYDMEDRSWELKKREEVLGGFSSQEYRTELLYAKAADGASIPISLVYRRGALSNGPAPLLLSGYGAYGASSDPYFSSARLSLLNRGMLWAIAHVRGGGEMGRAWYEAGKFLHKKNTFFDFIACSERLVTEGYTASDRLVISGSSAGGLLIGAVINEQPNLYHAAVADVPFVDVVNTMMDPTIPLTVIEYEEWGDPNQPEYYEYIKSYSPYDNVCAQQYPHLLITAGLNDPRVGYWEPAKWTAKLRDTKIGDNRLYLRTQMDSGHGGASGRYDYLKEIAFEYAFLLDVLGLATTAAGAD